ncbi:MAG: hypothetical protein U0572_05845 [Phycisphaerales bacterium]
MQNVTTTSAATARSDSHPTRTQPTVVADADPRPSQSELLDLAFAAASAIPAEPHIKDRSRAQELVVATCLKLGQPHRADAYAAKIDNWRRGTCLADLAWYYAQHADTARAEQYLEKANAVANTVDDWRRDRIRIRIAEVHAWMGQEDQATQLEAGVDRAEVGKVNAARAMQTTAAEFDSRLAAIQADLAKQDFDVARNALQACVHLFDTCYATPELRNRAEETIRTSWSPVPIEIRVAIVQQLAKVALEHGDVAGAATFVDDADALIHDANWSIEARIAVVSRQSALRYRVGGERQARADVDGALSLYDAENSKILVTERCEALRNLAEAYQVMGDASEALAIYRRAVEVAAANPNARPRALDLASTCASIAEYGAEPDPAFLARLRELQGQLGDPW